VNETIERGRNVALEIAIAFMLVSGVSPFVGLGLSVEHFPYGIAVAILVGRPPPLGFVIAAVTGAVFWVGSILYWGNWGNWVYLVQFINVLTPLVFFHSLRPKLERTAQYVFWLYIVFGTVQFLGLLEFAEPFLGNFIPRFIGGRAPGYRGVSSLESEPARASYQLLMLFIIANAKFRNRTVAFGALVVAELVVLRATSGLILTGAFVGFLAVGVLRGRPKLTPVLLLGVLAVGGFAYTSNPKIEEIVDETIDRGPQGFEDSILATSGGRYLAFKDTITDIVTQPLGRGADPSFAGNDLELLQNERYEDREGRGYKVERGVRPVSAILNTVRTFGIAMAILVAWAIRRDLFNGKRPDFTPSFWFVILAALIYGPSGSEALLIALGVAGRGSDAPAAESDNSPLLEPAT